MFDATKNPFEKQAKTIPQNVQIVFVCDMYADEYVGGAELTTQALIDSCNYEYVKLKSSEVSVELLQSGMNCFWIFGNFANLNAALIPTIIANLKYAVLEYDYKYCKYRSPEKHTAHESTPCDCHNQQNGKLISAFYYGAANLWWMSEKQKERYHTLFPFLAERQNIVLSSVFSPDTLGKITALRQSSSSQRSGWVVLGSNSWIKGTDDALKWCVDNQKQHDVIWNAPYDDVLARLASAEGFVYLPKGGDTCPRMVIEAKLLGCKLKLNENVQHKDEEWFNSSNVEDIQDYLYAAPRLFWEGIKRYLTHQPTISGYTTTLNCLEQEYPMEKCINSMLAFCDEVIVVDGGSTDGTLDLLQKIKLSHPDKLIIQSINRDWSSERFAVFDGQQKAAARALCIKDFCWQMDSDEIVHEDDIAKIHKLVKNMPKNAEILSLPVIEYWGGPDKVRADIQPWKWRLSRNLPHITHGIPSPLRKFDSNGQMYAAEGTDGCDMIHAQTGESLQHLSFFTPDVENARRAGLVGNTQALQAYENWFNQVVNGLPCVFHYSWFDISRKIKLYKKYWTKHWNSLYNKKSDDSAQNNMMFDMPWSSVTDDMIVERANELKQIGGWIWHSKWHGEKTPWIKCNREQPQIMLI